MTRLTSLSWPAVLDAYAAQWADVVSPRELEELLPAAMVTHAMNRSFTWAGAVAQADAAELAEWGDAPLHYLRLALEPFTPESRGTRRGSPAFPPRTPGTGRVSVR